MMGIVTGILPRLPNLLFLSGLIRFIWIMVIIINDGKQTVFFRSVAIYSSKLFLNTFLVVIFARHGFGLIVDSMFESTTPGLTND